MIDHWAFRGAIGLILCLCLGRGAANGASPEYRLVAGDSVHIQVLNRGAEQFSTDVTVQQNGKVRIPVIPPISVTAKGLTLAEFETAMTRAYGTFIRDPLLILTPRITHVPQVYLFGAFGRNGAINLEGPMRALDILAASGGAPAGDLSHVMLIRGHTTRILNLEDALHSTDSPDNVELLPDDRLIAPDKQASTITVQGQVTAPRKVEWRKGLGVEDALFAAGGPSPRGDLERILVTRSDGTQVTVNLEKAILAGLRDDTVLEKDDIVTVQGTVENVGVAGAVFRPETIEFKPDLTLEKALTISGGETNRADLSHIKLVRKDPPSVESVDLMKARQEGTASTIALRPGDAVFVPDMTTQVFILGQVGRPGPVPYVPGMTVLDAFTSSGSVLPRADVTRVVVNRADGQHVTVNITKITRDGDTAQNIKLNPGDSLYVPENRRRVYVFGAVNQPGIYLLGENDQNNLLDVVQQAGGLSAGADPGRAQIYTQRGQETVSTPLHLDRVLKGDISAIGTVKPGEVLYVPFRKQGANFQQLLSIVAYVPFLFNLLRL